MKRLLMLVAALALAIPAAGIATAAVSGGVRSQIVGGQDATESYPFMALLSSSEGWGCGAALVRPTWIVTARHCVTGDGDRPSAPSTLSFRVGSLHHDSGGVIARAKRVIRNEQGADTALVELTSPVSAYASIDIASSAPVGSALRIIGWGCTKDPGCSGAELLRQLDTSVLADSKCGGGKYSLCVDNPDGWRGACYGDSGGPALIRAAGGWVLAGDTSGGTSSICGKGPSVYSELPTLKSWIEGYAGRGSGSPTPSPTPTPTPDPTPSPTPKPSTPPTPTPTPTPTPRPTTPPPGSAASLVGLAGKCADVRWGSDADGTPVQLWACNGSATQQWTAADDTLTALGTCLDASGGTYRGGTKVQVDACSGAASQKWQLRGDGSVYSQSLDRCLDVPNYRRSNGTQLTAYRCTGGANQRWALGTARG